MVFLYPNQIVAFVGSYRPVEDRLDPICSKGTPSRKDDDQNVDKYRAMTLGVTTPTASVFSDIYLPDLATGANNYLNL